MSSILIINKVRYPGIACGRCQYFVNIDEEKFLVDDVIDIPSHAYQFTFASNPLWSRFYAKGGEIQSYLKDVAWKYDVERHVRFRHMFQSAEWNEQNQKWHVTIKNLETGEVGREVLVSTRKL